MSDANTVDMSLQQSCDAAMLHANVEVRLLIDKANRLERHNAKLRQQRDTYRDLVGLMDHPDVNAQLLAENAKLRELAHLLLWGVDNDMPRDEGLVWSQKVDALTRELGIEVDG